MRFRFRGKSGKVHDISVSDRRLARMVRRCRDLPGQDLFQYLDDTGEPQPIDSADVNEYLRAIAEQDFTAKDFRTWAGTVMAAEQLAPSKEALIAAVAVVAERLGNTPAVCRKCYIHPAILNAYQDAVEFDRWVAVSKSGECPERLSASEAALLRFLRA
jgi:DNA topoisomerase I